jgi:hypothetical protein
MRVASAAFFATRLFLLRVRQRLRWRPASKRQDAASRHSSEKRYDQYYHDHAGAARWRLEAPHKSYENAGDFYSEQGVSMSPARAQRFTFPKTSGSN